MMSQENLEQVGVKKWVLGTALTTLLITGIGLGCYNLYLSHVEYRDVANLEKRYDQMAASLLVMQQKLDQAQQAKVYAEENINRLMDHLARYQDNMTSVQTDLVTLRRDVADIQKMPQMELSRRMETLSLLSTEVSVDYARQQIMLHRHFQSAIDQLKSARLRLSYALEEYPSLEQALEEAVVHLQNLESKEARAHVIERLEALKKALSTLSFKKVLQPYVTDYAEPPAQEQVIADSKWKEFFYQVGQKLRSVFVIRKGQQLDLTSATPEGQAAFMEQARSFIQQAAEAYHVGDQPWFTHHLDSLQQLSHTYLASDNTEVKQWMNELTEVKLSMMRIDVSLFDSLVSAMKEALKNQEQTMKNYRPELPIPAAAVKGGDGS